MVIKRNFKLFLQSFSLLLLITLNTGCKKDSNSDYSFHFELVTEEFKPLNYMENGTITGLGPELLREICRELDIPFETTVLPWDEGYAKVLNDQNTVLYSTALNAERRDLFKWAGPYASIDWLFYSSSANQVELTTIDDARMVSSIGVLSDYSVTQYLESEGFTNLVYCTDNRDAFNRLLNGDIDLFPYRSDLLCF